MNVVSDLDIQLQELAERYLRSLEDQLYDPNPRTDGYDKAQQATYIRDLLRDLARDAANLVPERPGEGE